MNAQPLTLDECMLLERNRHQAVYRAITRGLCSSAAEFDLVLKSAKFDALLRNDKRRAG